MPAKQARSKMESMTAFTATSWTQDQSNLGFLSATSPKKHQQKQVELVNDNLINL